MFSQMIQVQKVDVINGQPITLYLDLWHKKLTFASSTFDKRVFAVSICNLHPIITFIIISQACAELFGMQQSGKS